MKRFLILFILISAVSQAQEVKTQKDILVIPNTTLSDFNLKTGNNKIIPVKVSKGVYKDYGYAMVNKKFQYIKGDYSLETLSFEGQKLVRKGTVFHYGNDLIKPQKFGFNYTYNSKGILHKRESDKDDDGSFDIATYTFNSNGIIKKINETGVLGNGKTYNKNKNFIKKGTSLFYTFENGTKTLDFKNGLITKITTFNKSANKNYVNTYSYDAKGNLSFEDRGTSTSTYAINNKNLIEKEVQKLYTQHYKYIYDKYGNWIVAYQLAVSEKNYSGEKVKPHLYGTSFSFYVREIKYSNGETTGGKTPEHSTIKSSLLKVRSELYDELINGKKPYLAKKIRNLDLEFPLHEIEEDYGLRIKGNIVPIQLNKKQFDQRQKRNSSEIATELKIESSQTFDKNLRKVKVSKVTSRGTTTTYNFQYDSQARLKKYWSVGGRYGNTYENYSYQSNGNFTRNKSFKEGDQGIKSTFTKTSDGYTMNGESDKKLIAKNNLVKKIIYGYNKAEPSETLIDHNEYGKVIKRETSFATVINQYNSNGDLKFFEETIKNSGNTTSRTYVYEYDKYGNWIIQVNLLDMSIAKGIPSFPQPTLREIKYSNGEVTGTTDINKVKNELISLRKKVKNVNTNTGNQVATWKKTTTSNFYFYLDTKAVQKAKLSYMGKDILAFIQDNNQLYIMKDALSAATNTTFNAKKLTIETSSGYWFKKPNGGVTVFTNQGNAIQKSSLYKYAPNNMDVFYQGEGEPNKVVLKNYKNAKTLTVYPAINFDSYSNGNKTVTNTTAKRSGKCIKGDCDNGYGEYQYENGLKADGFFENGKPKGPMHLNNESKNESRFTTYNGSYDAQIGMLYMYYKNRYTDIVDYKKQYGVTNDATEKRTYKLNFKNGTVVSKTEMTGNNSNSGCIVGNCTNGSGVYKYNNGAFYFGTFQNGKRHGFGKLDFKGGNLYIGEFQNGSYHGLGTYVWSEYNYYMGEYRNGKYHGKGVMYYNKETFEAGNWENGKLGKKTNSTNKKNTSKNTTYTINKNASGFNSFSELQKNKILECKNNTECISRYITTLYVEGRKSTSGKALIKKTTNYFHSLYTMNPKLAYDTLFKMDMSLIDLKLLPQSVQTDLKKRAKNLADGYKKFKKKNGY